MNGRILCSHNKSGMRELWGFDGGGVLGGLFGTLYVTQSKAERKLYAKLRRLGKKLSYSELQIDTCGEVRPEGWVGIRSFRVLQIMLKSREVT